MFTGLIETLGECLAIHPGVTGSRLTVRAPEIMEGLKLGDSVAVNGCCLTVAVFGGERIEFDLLEETLRRTNLGSLALGSRVNLERALTPGSRMGGHFVQGHVDCTSQLLRAEQAGGDFRLEIALPEEFAMLAVFKGSIAIDGISLTIAELQKNSFSVCIIPHTLAVTTLALRHPGDTVNLEFDLLAKYVDRMLSLRTGLPVVPHNLP